jgi:hypothetical protein
MAYVMNKPNAVKDRGANKFYGYNVINLEAVTNY